MLQGRERRHFCTRKRKRVRASVLASGTHLTFDSVWNLKSAAAAAASWVAVSFVSPKDEAAGGNEIDEREREREREEEDALISSHLAQNGFFFQSNVLLFDLSGANFNLNYVLSLDVPAISSSQGRTTVLSVLLKRWYILFLTFPTPTLEGRWEESDGSQDSTSELLKCR